MLKWLYVKYPEVMRDPSNGAEMLPDACISGNFDTAQCLMELYTVDPVSLAYELVMHENSNDLATKEYMLEWLLKDVFKEFSPTLAEAWCLAVCGHTDKQTYVQAARAAYPQRFLTLE
jgi:hypothetical protein